MCHGDYVVMSSLLKWVFSEKLDPFCETQGKRITRSMTGEATMATKEQQPKRGRPKKIKPKPRVRPKKIRKPGRPKKIKPKPRVRVRKSPKGKRGRPPKPKLGVETELAEEMCLTLQDSMERRGTTASSAAAATADADLDSRDEAFKEREDEISVLEHQLAADNQKLNDSRDEAIKERDIMMKELGILRGQLQQVREDYEHQLKENIRCTDALEETCSSQRHKISVLERELDDANQKLKDALEARIALEKDREHQIMELEAKTRRLEEELEQAESRAAAAESSMQRFTRKCQDAANEADAKIGSVQVALGDAWNGDLNSWRIDREWNCSEE